MGSTMSNPRTVKRLMDLEIDEVSLVDRPANQHGLVAFAKRAEENRMTIYDAAGDEVFEDELEHGMVVYDDSGAEFVFVEDGEEGDGTTADLQGGYVDEPELVGKARGSELLNRGRKAREGWQAHQGGKTPLSFADEDFTRGFEGRKRVTEGVARGRKHVSSHRGKYAGGGGLAAGGTLGYASKSLGESVYEELSKALTADDRDQVISKAMDRVSKAEQAAEEAWSVTQQLQDREALLEFTEIAKGYGLPVEPSRLGRILKNAAATLPEEDLAELDRLLTAQGELYNELGSGLGMQDSQIHAQIEAMALETVGKADVTLEQATVALYEANPAAYDEYLQEG